jgi:hypothetical protein
VLQDEGYHPAFAVAWNLPPLVWSQEQVTVMEAAWASEESRDSSVGTALGYRLHDQGSKVRFPAGVGNFLFTTASRTALWPTQSPIQSVPMALSLRGKAAGV